MRRREQVEAEKGCGQTSYVALQHCSPLADNVNLSIIYLRYLIRINVGRSACHHLSTIHI
jgi:hypothetical protein